MEIVAYLIATAIFGFGCWALGVYMGAKNAVDKMVEKLNQ